MVGPSSSHTAGALRLAKIAMHLLGQIPEKAEVIFPSTGSFATSYRGHGSDKAIIGGLMGFYSNDPRIRESYSLAEENNLEVKFTVEDFHKKAHPNTIRFHLYSKDKEVTMEGISVGGGNISVTSILGFPIEYDGTMDIITVYAEETPGLLIKILERIDYHDIHLNALKAAYLEEEEDDFVESKEVYLNLELKSYPSPEAVTTLVSEIKSHPKIIGVRYIPKLRFAIELVLDE